MRVVAHPGHGDQFGAGDIIPQDLRCFEKWSILLAPEDQRGHADLIQPVCDGLPFSKSPGDVDIAIY